MNAHTLFTTTLFLTASAWASGNNKYEVWAIDGVFESVAPMTNIDAGGVERADAHALWVRLKRK